jgi:hypothetical protein
MATNFPGSVDTLSNPASGDATNTSGGHAAQHANANDAIEALERLGVKAYSVLEYGADRTGSSSSTTAFSNAHDAAVSGGGYVYIPPGTYLLGQITKTTSPKWVGAGVGLVTLNMASGISGSGSWLNFSGSLGSAISLTANAAMNARSLSLTTTGLAAGDILIVGANTAYSTDRPTEYIGQSVEVLGITNGSALTLKQALVETFTTAASGHARKMTPITDVILKGFTLNNPNPLSGYVIQLTLKYARGVDIDLAGKSGDSMGIELWSCYNGRVKFDAQDYANDTDNFRYGYGVAAMAATSHFEIEVRARNCRHAFTTNSPDTTYTPNDYGGPNGIVVRGVATGCTAEAWDTHPGGKNIVFLGCEADGGIYGSTASADGGGFQIRSANTSIIGGLAANCATGVKIGWNGYKNAVVRGLSIIDTDNTAETGYGHAFRLENEGIVGTPQTGVVIENCYLENIATSVLRLGSGPRTDGLLFRNNYVRNWGVANTSGERAIVRAYTGANTGFRIEGNILESTAANCVVFYGTGAYGTGNTLIGNNIGSNISWFQAGVEPYVKCWGNSTGGVPVARVYVGTFSATPTIDASLGEAYQLTLTANVTSSTISNATTGQLLRVILVQDGTGSRTFAWPSNVKWNGGGAAPTLQTAANSVDVFEFYYNGTNWYQLR